MIRFDPNSAALTIHNLTAGYDRHPAIHHLTATIPTGSLVALLGPNGAGKTTLLRVLAGELLPMTGQITVPALWRGRIAYLPQRPSWRLEFPLTVEEAIALALWSEVGFWRPFPPSLRARIEEVLTLLELAPFARRPISHLSGGQQQRVRFAQLLIRSPALLLLDEPFTALDPPT
ncbi:MAG: ATP-binding cassette domain-containing protein, partial [Acidimicrobiales bacterium]|nr:ATP-binding cassette domain-containing protein [Acidimicrobiales bacterium]